jgi:hypothetical protein
MQRHLTIQRSTVTSTDRNRYLAGLAERKSQYANAGCRFWVFEEVGLPGAFVEFTESDSESVLRSAHDSVGHIVTAPRVYQELEIG